MTTSQRAKALPASGSALPKSRVMNGGSLRSSMNGHVKGSGPRSPLPKKAESPLAAARSAPVALGLRAAATTVADNKSTPETKVTSVSSGDSIELRRAYTMPSTTSESKEVVMINLRKAHSDLVGPVHRLDRFGFILNMDSQGNIHEADLDHIMEDDRIISFAEAQLNTRREKKWDNMMNAWTLFSRRRSKLVLKRLRKGVPDSRRGKVWPILGRVPDKMRKNRGLYDKLVRRALFSSPSKGGMKHTKSFRTIQETIERDIHRTFPRHSMFYDDEESEEEVEEEEQKTPEDQDVGHEGLNPDDAAILCGTAEISSMIKELELSNGINSNHPDYVNPDDLLQGVGGQSSLRRVLRAYSSYDTDVGYCQGMNFIAGMFLTLMPEEEAFWLLVYVMQDAPCKMKGLFGEGMRETHKVLYVAEKLIHQFLPKLAKHLEKENVHITMFATQWLLTQYASSFKFDLVTRVWDCFLGEGWKITYRVMLALLMHAQPTLLKMSFEEILAYFRELPDRVEGYVIIEAALKIPLRWKHILRYESDWKSQPEH